MLFALPVDEVQIELLEAELGHAGVESAHGLVVAVIGVPQFCRDVDVLAREATLGKGSTRLRLVGIHRGTVEVAISNGERLRGGGLRLTGRNLPQAESDLRDGRAVIQGNGGDGARIN